MTLTELSYYSRRFLPFIILIFIILMIVFYSLKLLLFYFQLNKPTTIYTNPIFGKITRPEVNQASAEAGLNYILDTIEGEPVTATGSASVYLLPQPLSRFGYREKIYLIAKTLGFDTETAKYRLVGNEAVFSDDKQDLSIDISNFNFTYKYNFESDPQLFEQATTPVRQQAEDRSVDFLKQIGRYPDELAKGKTNVIFLSYSPQLQRMEILGNNVGANLVEVDFYRPDVDGFPVVSPSFFNSQNYVFLVFFDQGYKVLKAQIKFFEKSDAQKGIYPLISGNQAYENLKSGKAYFIKLPEAGESVTINKMFLAYFDPDTYQNYLQPVYVFLGKEDFVAYTPAVSDDYFIK